MASKRDSKNPTRPGQPVDGRAPSSGTKVPRPKPGVPSAPRGDGDHPIPNGGLRAKQDGFIRQVNPQERPVPAREVAPELSQGKWRERVVLHRHVLTREEIVERLERTLHDVVNQFDGADVLFQGWLPLLRQVVEQAGGDGMDAWLNAILRPPGRPPRVGLVDELASAMRHIFRTDSTEDLEQAAKAVIKQIDRALSRPDRPRLSLAVMERDLEGKIDVDSLLRLKFLTTDGLERAVKEFRNAIEQLRNQSSSQPGHNAAGMYANFSRLTLELRVAEAEQRHRRDDAPID
jgi:hypothetical protein